MFLTLGRQVCCYCKEVKWDGCVLVTKGAVLKTDTALALDVGHTQDTHLWVELPVLSLIHDKDPAQCQRVAVTLDVFWISSSCTNTDVNTNFILESFYF